MSDQIVVLKMSELSSVMSAVADQAVAKAMRLLPKHGQPRPFHVTQKQAAEMLKWRMTSAQMRFDAWRTEQASNRQIEKITK